MKKIGFILFCAAQIGYLVVMGSMNSYITHTGKEIVLQSNIQGGGQDLFYGGYFHVNTVINDIAMNEEEKKNWSIDQPIYVELAPEGRFDIVKKYDHQKFKAESNEDIVLKGNVRYLTMNGIGVTYGFEKYYMDENKARELENDNKNLVVHLKYSPLGILVDKIEKTN